MYVIVDPKLFKAIDKKRRGVFLVLKPLKMLVVCVIQVIMKLRNSP